MESGSQVYHFDYVDISLLLQESLTVFAANQEKHSLRLEVDTALPSVRTDTDRIRQVLANLVSNAIKYSPNGGEVRVGACQKEANLVVWVADQGIGIAPEALSQLFRKFQRIDNAETRSIGGTGLGLALVKEIIEAHGGRVWVESKLEQGSTFFFTLPLEAFHTFSLSRIAGEGEKAPTNYGQHDMGRNCRAVKDRLVRHFPTSFSGLIPSGIEVAVETRKVTRRDFYTYSMPRQEHMACCPQVDGQLVHFSFRQQLRRH